MATITLTVPNAKFTEFKAGFLRKNPVPDDWTGTQNEWVEERIKRMVRMDYVEGKHLLASDASVPVVDGDIVQ